MLKWIYPVVALCLVLFVMPVVAEPPEEAGTEPTEAVVSEGPESQEASIQSVCTADCGPYPDVTCTGSSCNAEDRNCPSQRGQCWGSDTGTKYCKIPCICFAEASCSPSGSVSCQGMQQCDEQNDCWVECDGQKTWCPAHPPECIP